MRFNLWKNCNTHASVRRVLTHAHSSTYLLIAGLIVSIMLRIPLFDGWIFGWRIHHWDLDIFIGYYRKMQQRPEWWLTRDFTKLSSLMLYVWVLASDILTLKPSLAVKLCTMLFDYACAFWVFRLVRLCHPTPSLRPCIASLCVLFAPVSVLNASLWGQLDPIYTSFLLATVFFLARKYSTHGKANDAWYAAIPSVPI